jgi:hypothetical protein
VVRVLALWLGKLSRAKDSAYQRLEPFSRL